MPKFAILQNGTNAPLLQTVDAQVQGFLKKIFEEHEIIKTNDTYSFGFGSVQISIKVLPWHSEDVLVNVYAYLADNFMASKESAEELLRLNAQTPFGSFGLTFDNTVMYSYALPGKNIDFSEFLAAVQTVATIADSYDERVLEMKM